MNRDGVFIDALQLNHRAPDDVDTARVETQARQTALFAIAYGQGWQIDRSLDLCEAGLERLMGPALREDGRPGEVLDAEGRSLVEAKTSTAMDLELLHTHARIVDLVPPLAERAEAAAEKLRSSMVSGGGQPVATEPLREIRTELAWLEALPERQDRKRLREVRKAFSSHLDAAPAWKVFHGIDLIWRAGRLREDIDVALLQSLYLRASGAIDQDGRLVHAETGEHHALDQALALRAHLAMLESGLSREAALPAALSFDTLMDENLTFEGGWIAGHDAGGLPLDRDMPAELALDFAGTFIRLLEVVQA